MRFFITLLITCFLCVLTKAQDIEAPPSDKSVVYFMRPNGLGIIVNFTYYDGDQIIGKFNGAKYMRYECEPGEHTFWARSENRSFLKANLAAGKIYVVEALPVMGAFKAGVDLLPINPKVANMKRFQKLLAKQPSVTFTAEALENWNTKMQGVTERGMQRLEELEKKNKRFAQLREDMFVEPDELKFVKKTKKRKKKKAKKTKKEKAKKS